MSQRCPSAISLNASRWRHMLGRAFVAFCYTILLWDRCLLGTHLLFAPAKKCEQSHPVTLLRHKASPAALPGHSCMSHFHGVASISLSSVDIHLQAAAEDRDIKAGRALLAAIMAVRTRKGGMGAWTYRSNRACLAVPHCHCSWRWVLFLPRLLYCASMGHPVHTPTRQTCDIKFNPCLS